MTDGLQVPALINILEMPFTVEVMNKDESLGRDAEPGAIGMTQVLQQRITIRGPEDLSHAMAVETLLHEVLHAIIEVYGIRVLMPEGDEAFVTVLTPALLHTLRANPTLVRALLVDWSRVREAGAADHDNELDADRLEVGDSGASVHTEEGSSE